MTLDDACEFVGVHRVTVWQWRAKGQEDPRGRYGQFERALNKALIEAKSFLIKGIAKHPDVRGKIFILKNRYPAEFRDRIVQEVSGPDGQAVPLNVNINPFEIKIVMAGGEETFKTVAYNRFGLQGEN